MGPNERRQLEKELEHLDYGYCNPRKSSEASERANEIQKRLDELDGDGDYDTDDYDY